MSAKFSLCFVIGYFAGIWYPKPRYYALYYIIPPCLNPHMNGKTPVFLHYLDDSDREEAIRTYEEYKQKYYDALLVKMNE